MNETKQNALSVSLPNRSIYAVCYTPKDGIAAFHGPLYLARRRFFETGKKVKLKETGIYSGLPGTLQGKMGKKDLKWEIMAGKSKLQGDFTYHKQRGVEFREPNGILLSRVFFDKEHRWQRSEYFAPEDPTRARVSFKPDSTRDAVLRFDYNNSTGNTKETVLYPVPYAYQTPEQSLQNAQFGDDLLIIATDMGEFAYCPKEEQEKRLAFLEDNRDASVMLSIGWEVKDGDIASAEPETAPAMLPAHGEDVRDPEVIFENIEDAVRFEQAEEAEVLLEELLEETESPAEETAHEIPAEEDEPKPAAPEADTKEEETSPAAADALLTALGITKEDAEQARSILDRLLQKPEETAAAPKEKTETTLVRAGAQMQYDGELENGKRDGFGRTYSAEGITVYEGEYKNDLREGFGAHHYKSGAVSYIGDFKADKRDGFGVSFRESDHAVHVSHWAEGKPQGYAALFDSEGTMRFAGKITDGLKQGAGVSIDPEKDTVFVARYENNEMTGEGALFAGDGTLLYTGGWENGKRNGRGTEFDRNGDIVYSGEWKDDRYLNGILYKKVQGDPENGSN